MKTTKKQQEASDAPEEKIKVEYNNAFVLKGNNLQPFITNPETSAKIAQDKQSLEKKFKNDTELSDIVLNNGKILFGEQTIFIDCLTKNNIELSGGFVPDGLLFDLTDPVKPKLYFVEIMLSQKNFAELFLRMTNLFSIFKNQESVNQFTTTIANAIRKNIGWRNKLKSAFGDKEVHEFLENMFTRRPPVLLVMDIFKQELTGFMETYTDTWGKCVKPILLRKFAINGETIVTMSPTLAEINNKKNGKDVKVKSSEEDHLENVSETVKDIFLEIKSELQKVNIDVEFRVKQHYISLRKDKNLAFFQLGKKKLSIVIANPGKNMQKEIKHHEIRVLAPSVKRFWNGNEHCFTLVIESKEHLEEITSLLKKLIKGEDDEVRSSDETAPETPEIAPEAIKKAKTGKISSQAKPKRKGKK